MPETTPFDSILAQCRDLVCERLTAALSGMLDKVDDAVLALIKETRDARTQKLYMATRDKVLAQRDAIESQFRIRYLREFQERSNRVKKIGASFSDIDLSTLELELVPEDDLEETLKFNAMAAKLRQYCEEELVALDQRMGVLLGDAGLQPEDDPFTPQGICDAYKHTCRQIESDVDVRTILLKLFDDYVLDDIRPIYKAANAFLVENSILPKIRGHAARPEGGKAPPGAPSETAAQEAAGEEQDLFSVLHKLLATRKPATQAGASAAAGAPAPAAAASPALAGAPAQGMVVPPRQPPVAGAPGGAAGATDEVRAALQGAELLRSLTRLQLGDVSAVGGPGLPLAGAIVEPGTTNVLHELKGTSLASGMNQMDVMTLDIMAMLFDQLFDDPEIPAGVKGLIGRLQIPMLKVAIADKAFFSKKTHPARQMLDTLGEVSARLPADFNASNPLYAQLEEILQELIDGFEDNIEIFDAVRERLQTLIAEEDRRVEQEMQSAARQIEQQESLALAKTVAQAEIKVRLRGRDVPRQVSEFLVEEWVKFLIVVEVKFGESSDDWKKALETMDLLIWSVEPKSTAEDRRRLVSTVPELLKRLAAGLQTAGVEEAVRTRFFNELRKLHTEMISRAAAANGAAAANVPAPSESVPVLQPASAPEQMEPAAPVAPILPSLVIPPVPGIGETIEAAEPAPTAALPPLPPIPPSLVTPPLAAKSAALDVGEPAPSKAAAPIPPAPSPPARPVAPSRPGAVEAAKPAAAPKPVAAPVPPAPVTPAAPGKASAPEPASLNFTRPVTVANPFGDGKVQVDDLDFTAQLGPSAPAAKRGATVPDIPDSLVVGAWVEIYDKGERESRRPARLSFVSPLKTRYLFVNRQGKTTLECSRAELARRFRLGEVTITNQVSETPLFDRIAEGLVDKLGGSKGSG
ncbi:MAG TPA: DUF1631 family protein [Burkholderiales bacterium]|nr:DUF1631 family protein [Burkholderiales bacterium]